MEKFIKETIKEAGKIILEGFESELEVDTKNNPHDLVTQYDHKVESFIVARIQEAFPKAGIYAEERGFVKESKDFFLIDPIDGTFNFTRNIPLSCTIIAFISDNNVQMGAVYDPYRDELFFAERGKGASLNELPIRVSQNNDTDYVVGHFTASNNYFEGIVEKYKDKLKSVARQINLKDYKMNSSGFYLSYTAAGRFDMIGQAGPSPWDMAAGSLLLEEAGAKVTTMDGDPYRWDSKSILAANPALHEKIITEING